MQECHQAFPGYTIANQIHIENYDPDDPIPHYQHREFIGIDEDVNSAIQIAAFTADIDPIYVLAVARSESSLRLYVKGDHGKAYGLFQLHIAYRKKIAPWLLTYKDPVSQGLLAGAWWSRLIKRYGRLQAARLYACGFPCRPKWITPIRWQRYL